MTIKISPASPGRIHQILVTTPQTPTRIQTNADTGCVSRKQNGRNELRIKLTWMGIRDMQNILISYSANGFRRTLQDYR